MNKKNLNTSRIICVGIVRGKTEAKNPVSEELVQSFLVVSVAFKGGAGGNWDGGFAICK